MQRFGWPQHDFGVLSASADTWSFAPHCRAGQSPICQPSHHHVVRVSCSFASLGWFERSRRPRPALFALHRSWCSLLRFRNLFDDVPRRSGVARVCCSAVRRSVTTECHCRIASQSRILFKSFVSSRSFQVSRFTRSVLRPEIVSITRKGSSSRQKAAAHSERLIEEFTQVSAHANSTIPRAIFQLHF